ncbi:MAG TPA: nucleotidyltransferase domain-containing protein [Streptosporangiaceae bacterium]
MFTPGQRDQLRETLIEAARSDERVTGAALTGSAAMGAEDAWSDIDLALGIAGRADASQVMADWTRSMYRDHGAVHHFDVVRGATVFRVFLLGSTLQVDIAFWPEAEFGPIAPSFRLMFGTPAEPGRAAEPAAAELIGLGWLYALHARSSINRGRAWQAEYMISGIRDQALALACVRHRLPAAQGRGIDRLPPEVTEPIAGALVRSLAASELSRAFTAACEGLLAEASLADTALASRLAGPVTELTRATWQA